MIKIKDLKNLRVFEVNVMGDIKEVTMTAKITEKQLQELLSDDQFTITSDSWLFNGFKRAAAFSIKRLKIRIQGLESHLT